MPGSLISCVNSTSPIHPLPVLWSLCQCLRRSHVLPMRCCWSPHTGLHIAQYLGSCSPNTQLSPLFCLMLAASALSREPVLRRQSSLQAGWGLGGWFCGKYCTGCPPGALVPVLSSWYEHFPPESVSAGRVIAQPSLSPKLRPLHHIHQV